MIRIESLTKRTIEEAIALLESVFPGEEEEVPGLELPASLNPEKYRDFLTETRMSNIRYWVAVNDSGKVVGTTGLYCYENDKEEAFWLGWFAVEPDVRRRGIGTALLQFSIREAQRQGKRFLRLYTSTDEQEEAARRLYERYGFKLTKEEEVPSWGDIKKLYYELDLRG